MPTVRTPILEVFDRAGTRRGVIGYDAWDEVRVVLRMNATSTATVLFPWKQVQRRPYLLEEGIRIQVWHRGAILLSGPAEELVGEGPTVSGGLQLIVESDFQILQRLTCWPAPAQAIGSQTVEQQTLRGPAETVFLNAVRANRDRLGMTLGTGTNQGRGDQASVGLRFHTPADELVPLLTASGLAVEIVDDPYPATTRQLRVTAPRTFPHTLTETSGAVSQWKFTRRRPGATRAVVGGPGDGVARLLTVVTDTNAEARWGMAGEIFVDARDIGGDWSEAVDARPGLRNDLRDADKDVAEADSKRLTRQKALDAALAGVRFHELAVKLAEQNVDAAAQRVAESNTTANQQIRTKTQATLADAQADLADANDDRNDAQTALNTATTAWQAAVTARTAAAAAITTNDAKIITERAEAIAEMTQRGREKLAEIGTQAGISVTVTETDQVQVHPDQLWTGVEVSVETIAGITHTARLQEINLGWTADEGYTATPTVGEQEAGPIGALIKKIANATRTIRRHGIR